MSVEKICKCDRCGKPFDYSLSKWAGYFKYGIKKENRLCLRLTIKAATDKPSQKS